MFSITALSTDESIVYNSEQFKLVQGILLTCPKLYSGFLVNPKIVNFRNFVIFPLADVTVSMQ